MFTTKQDDDSYKETWKETELFLRWTLSREDKDVVLRFRGAPARLYGAIQLLTIRHSDRTWTDLEDIPRNILQFICEFLETDLPRI